MSSTIKLVGYKELVTQVNNLQKMQWLRDSLYHAADNIIKPIAQDYPPESHRPQPFKTARQRRGFFAKLKDGEITVPYVRTNTLKNNWKSRLFKAGLAIMLENNTSYGGYVHGNKLQARYHEKTGWKTEKKIADAARPEVIEYLDKALQKILAS